MLHTETFRRLISQVVVLGNLHRKLTSQKMFMFTMKVGTIGSLGWIEYIISSESFKDAVKLSRIKGKSVLKV